VSQPRVLAERIRIVGSLAHPDDPSPEVVVEGHEVVRPVELLAVGLVFDDIQVEATRDLVVRSGVRDAPLLATRSEPWETLRLRRVINTALDLVDDFGEERIGLGRVDGSEDGVPPRAVPLPGTRWAGIPHLSLQLFQDRSARRLRSLEIEVLSSKDGLGRDPRWVVA
jgi:hypothetical protein